MLMIDHTQIFLPFRDLDFLGVENTLHLLVAPRSYPEASRKEARQSGA
jgi:hypothetical protein